MRTRRFIHQSRVKLWAEDSENIPGDVLVSHDFKPDLVIGYSIHSLKGDYEMFYIDAEGRVW